MESLDVPSASMDTTWTIANARGAISLAAQSAPAEPNALSAPLISSRFNLMALASAISATASSLTCHRIGTAHVPVKMDTG